MISTVNDISRCGRFLPMFEFKDGNWATPWRWRPNDRYCESCWFERCQPVRDRLCRHTEGGQP